MGAGSGSDGEATGGEMSDGAVRKKKLKLVSNSARGTPSASRAGSPIPTQGGKYKTGAPCNPRCSIANQMTNAELARCLAWPVRLWR